MMKENKAPFGPWDVVVKVAGSNGPNTFIGHIYTVKEIIYNGKPAWGCLFFGAPRPKYGSGYYDAGVYRLYEPPKQKEAQKDRQKEKTE